MNESIIQNGVIIDGRIYEYREAADPEHVCDTCAVRHICEEMGPSWLACDVFPSDSRTKHLVETFDLEIICKQAQK